MDDLNRENFKRTRAERDIDLYISIDIPMIRKQLTQDKKFEKPAQIGPNEALDKIKKHLKDSHKYSKSIDLLHRLIKRHYNKFPIPDILETLETIFNSGFVNEAPRQKTQEIFTFTFEKLKESLSDDQQDKFSKWLFIADVVNSIHTDDSHIFHQNLKTLTHKLAELNDQTAD